MPQFRTRNIRWHPADGFSRIDPRDAPEALRELPQHPSDIWTLRGWCPAAARAALNGNPCLIFWHFQLG